MLTADDALDGVSSDRNSLTEGRLFGSGWHITDGASRGRLRRQGCRQLRPGMFCS